MKRRQKEVGARPVGSVTAAQADGGEAERGEGVSPTAQGAIARRAYELYLERGAEPGQDIEDWFQAEAELRGARRQ